jgi:PAS domain S-box-containing protein
MFGYARSEILGRSPQFLAPSDVQAKDYVERSRESYAKNGFFQEKMKCKRKDGSIFMTMATNLALFGSSGELEFILAINRDITTEEKMLEEVLMLSEKSKLVLEALNKSIMPFRSPEPRPSLGSIGFSRRQIEIAAILLAGEPTKIIADRLRISESAVKNHLSVMYRRLGVGSRVEFVKYIHNHGILLE